MLNLLPKDVMEIVHSFLMVSETQVCLNRAMMNDEFQTIVSHLTVGIQPTYIQRWYDIQEDIFDIELLYSALQGFTGFD